MHAVHTSLGLVGVAICIAFSDTSGLPHAAWGAVAAQWMLVPSMGEESTIEMHRRAADMLRDQHRTTTLVSNQSAQGDCRPGFIVASGMSDAGTANTVTVLPRHEP